MSGGNIVADGKEAEDLQKSVTSLTPEERARAKAKIDDAFRLQTKLDQDRSRDEQLGRRPVIPQSPSAMSDLIEFDHFRDILLDSFASGRFGKPITLDDMMHDHDGMVRKRADQAAIARKQEADYKAEVDRQRTDANREQAKKYQAFIHATPGFEVTPDLILQATDARSCSYCGSRFPVDLVPRFDVLLRHSQRGSGVWIEQRRHSCPGDAKHHPPIPGRMLTRQPWGVWIDVPGAAGMEPSGLPPRLFIDERPLV
jgi:hypothetical protein